MAQKARKARPRRKPARGRAADSAGGRTAGGIVDDGPIVISGGIVDDGPIVISGGIVDDGPVVISGKRRAIDDEQLLERSRAKRTGRQLILLPVGATRAAHRALWNKAGLRAQSAKESGGAPPERGGVKIFTHLGVAVSSADPDQLVSLARAAGAGILAQPEDEFILYAAGAGTQWLRGYRDAVTHLTDHLLADGGADFATSAELPAAKPHATWGVVATRADQSGLSGKGIRIAVLDTGIDSTHPDFVNRPIVSQSFITGQGVHDGNGHGTHCAGVACGAMQGAIRYGVANQAELYVGKVLSDLGEGPEQGILHGIDWAMENKCRVVSMSLSAQAAPSPLFNQVGKRALAAGTLLIAAAGNDSNRPHQVMPVGYPANSDSILAVAAVDQKLRIARFSNAGADDGGGQVDIAGPGVGVYSAWSGARRYKQESGTSMATPFVAGIAALLAEASPGAAAEALFRTLRQSARKLDGLGQRDIGAGLVQAPS